MSWHINYVPPIDREQRTAYLYSLVDNFGINYTEDKVDPAVVMGILQGIVDQLYCLSELVGGIDNINGHMLKTIKKLMHPTYNKELGDYIINMQILNDNNLRFVIHVHGMRWEIYIDDYIVQTQSQRPGLIVTVNSDNSTEE